MTNFRRIFSLCVKLIIPKGITEKPESQEKHSTILLHNPTTGGPPAPNYLIVMDLGVGGRETETPSWHWTNQSDGSIG